MLARTATLIGLLGWALAPCTDRPNKGLPPLCVSTLCEREPWCLAAGRGPDGPQQLGLPLEASGDGRGQLVRRVCEDIQGQSLG